MSREGHHVPATPELDKRLSECLYLADPALAAVEGMLRLQILTALEAEASSFDERLRNTNAETAAQSRSGGGTAVRAARNALFSS
jgi:hypothetical protein